jgi:hypothetical protein
MDLSLDDAGFDLQSVPANTDEEYTAGVWQSSPSSDVILRSQDSMGTTNNRAFLRNAANAGIPGLFQDVPGDVTFTAGMTYTFSAEVGRVPQLNYASNTTLELREGASAGRRRAANDLLAARTVSLNELPADGSLLRFAVTYTVALGSAVAGQPVRVAFSFSGSGQTFSLDSTQLSVSPALVTTTLPTTTTTAAPTALPPGVEVLPLADPSFEMQTVPSGSSALYIAVAWTVPASGNLQLSSPDALDVPAAAPEGDNVAHIVNAATIGQGIIQAPPGAPTYEGGFQYFFSLAAAQDASVNYDSVLLIGFLADDGSVLASTLVAALTSDFSRATATLTVDPASAAVGDAVRIFISAAGTGPSFLFDSAALGRAALPTTTTTTTAPPPNATYTFAVYHNADDVLVNGAAANAFLNSVETALGNEGVDTSALVFTLLTINNFPWIAVQVKGPQPDVKDVEDAVRCALCTIERKKNGQPPGPPHVSVLKKRKEGW